MDKETKINIVRYMIVIIILFYAHTISYLYARNIT